MDISAGNNSIAQDRSIYLELARNLCVNRRNAFAVVKYRLPLAPDNLTLPVAPKNP